MLGGGEAQKPLPGSVPTSPRSARDPVHGFPLCAVSLLSEQAALATSSAVPTRGEKMLTQGKPALTGSCVNNGEQKRNLPKAGRVITNPAYQKGAAGPCSPPDKGAGAAFLSPVCLCTQDRGLPSRRLLRKTHGVTEDVAAADAQARVSWPRFQLGIILGGGVQGPGAKPKWKV